MVLEVLLEVLEVVMEILEDHQNHWPDHKAGRFISNFQQKRKFSLRRPPGQLQARMTHQQTSERFEKAHCLVKNTVGLQEAENGALLCSLEMANKPRSLKPH